MRPIVSERTLADIMAYLLGCIADDLLMAWEAHEAVDGALWDWEPLQHGCILAGGAIMTPSSILASYLTLHASPDAVRADAMRDRELLLMIERRQVSGEAMLRILHGLLHKYGENIEGFNPRWRDKIELALNGVRSVS